MIGKAIDYAESSWDSYWNPPTFAEKLRRSRARIARDTIRIQRDASHQVGDRGRAVRGHAVPLDPLR